MRACEVELFGQREQTLLLGLPKGGFGWVQLLAHAQHPTLHAPLPQVVSTHSNRQ